jgi:hypothetical protein
MEKTIMIDGKEVRLKSTAATALRYKAQFGKDFISEIVKLNRLGKLDLKYAEEVDLESLENVDFEVFYNFTWVLAKTADPTVPDPLSWLDKFDEFPLFDIIPQIQDILAATIQGKKK